MGYIRRFIFSATHFLDFRDFLLLGKHHVKKKTYKAYFSPIFFRPLQHKRAGGFILIGNDAVNGVLDGAFQCPDLPAGRQIECFS